MPIITYTTAFQLQEWHTNAIGVEYPAITEPAGDDRDKAWKKMADRISKNPAAYAPTTGIRLVLVGGAR